MPSRDPNRRAAPPSISAKIRSIRGLASDERALLLRIGNLVDATAIVERELANPGLVNQRDKQVTVPKPQNLTVTAILGGIQIDWDPVEFDRFESYEVQVDTSSTFASPDSFPALTNRLTFKTDDLDTTVGTLFARVRVVGIRGTTGEFSDAGSATLLQPVTEGDFDSNIPENRTRVSPPPNLVGSIFIDLPSGVNLYVGVGGAVGPGPFTFTDTSGDDAANPKHQISYTLQENIDGAYVDQQTSSMGLPTNFNEPDVDEGARVYNTLTGSFTDQFYIYDVQDSAIVQVEFLDYVQTPHEQTGVVQYCTLSTIKY